MKINGTQRQLNVFTIVLLANCAVGYTASSIVQPISLKKTMSARATIEANEPIVLKLTYEYQESVEPIRQPFPHSFGLVVKQIEGTEEPSVYTERPKNIREGLKEGEFVCDLILWYDWVKSPLQPIFRKPGIYEISFRESVGVSPKVNVEVVHGSRETELAISLLTDPNDLALLMGADRENEAPRMGTLERIATDCGKTTIAKLASARLGLERFKAFRKKHLGLGQAKAEQMKSELRDPLLDKAYQYLKEGATLPDEFPIRQEVLLQLAVAEYLNDDFVKAYSVLDELAAKYPNGNYGKKAVRAEAELKEIEKREIAEKNKK